MFTGTVCTKPSDELKHKFPNLYMEPMQFDNSEGKQQKEIPYMMINLDYNDEVYIGKNTHVAYIEEESVECNYIEVCESFETTECHNWRPRRKIVNSDLVYSLRTGNRAHNEWSLKTKMCQKKLNRSSRN